MSFFSTRLPTIQARISVLVIACILPAALATTLLLCHDYWMERADMERSTVDTARAVDQTIDHELIGAEATLRILSSSPYLKNGDLESFYGQTQEILQGVQDTVFVLSDINGQELINTLKPFGSLLPKHGDAAHFNRVLQANQPVISDLFVGGISRRQLIAVEIAVRRNKSVEYVLSIGFFTTRLAEILERQHLQKDQVISILDRTGAMIARTRQDAEFIGNNADPALFALLPMHTQGTVEAKLPTGVASVIAFHRSSISNWTVTVDTPRATVIGAMSTSLLLIVGGTVLLLALGLTLAQILGRKISRSLKGLVTPALALGHGNAVVLPELRLREADAVGQALLKAEKLIRQRTVERDLATQDAQHIREVKQHFEYQAYHDALTGLPNRILFNKLIQEGIAACANKDENLIVFYIDVDDFKRINDCYGHTVGDELLRLFAHRLKAGLRESDVTARLGGDEFAAILMRTGLSQAEATAEALVGALSHPYMIDEVAVVVSASIGAAGYPDSGSTPEELLKHADAAMYQAKTNGKHRCVFHQSIDSGSAS